MSETGRTVLQFGRNQVSNAMLDTMLASQRHIIHIRSWWDGAAVDFCGYHQATLKGPWRKCCYVTGESDIPKDGCIVSNHTECRHPFHIVAMIDAIAQLHDQTHAIIMTHYDVLLT